MKLINSIFFFEMCGFYEQCCVFKGVLCSFAEESKTKKLHIYFINDVLKQNQKTEIYAITE